MNCASSRLLHLSLTALLLSFWCGCSLDPIGGDSADAVPPLDSGVSDDGSPGEAGVDAGEAGVDGGEDGSSPACEPGPESPGGFCSEHWCWENPVPQGNSVDFVWASGPDDVWVVEGIYASPFLFSHYDGVAWTGMPSPVDAKVLDLWGSAPDDVWVIFDRPKNATSSWVFRWDGVAWSEVSLPSYTLFPMRVAGTARDDVWLYGASEPVTVDGGVAVSLVLHFDGAQWSAVPVGLAVDSMLALAPDDLWASVWGAGFDHGQVLHYDGTGWTAIDGMPVLREFVGFDSGEFYAATWSDADEYASRIVYWDGNQFTDSVDLLPGSVQSLWGAEPSDVWAVVLDLSWNQTFWHYDGVGWSQLAPPLAYPVMAIHGTSTDDVWAVGAAGGLAHYDGVEWTANVNVVEPPGNIMDIAGSGPDNVWVVSPPDAYRFDGTAWARHTPGNDAAAVWSAGSSDTWVVGDGIRHYDGTAWSQAAGDSAGELMAVHGSAPDNVWAGGKRLLRFDGATWQSLPPIAADTEVRDIWVAGPNDAWLVGGKSMNSGDSYDISVYHHDGTSAVAMSPGYCQFVAGTGAKDVWATGTCGLWHFDGASWTNMDGPGGTAILPLAPNDVWVLSGRYVNHFDGSGWSTEDTKCASYLRGIWGTSACDLRVVGDDGAILMRR